MPVLKFSFTEFQQLIKIARYQFLLKTKKGVYFLSLPNYSSYNENGFIAHNEISGEIEILSYSDVNEVTIDSKKFHYS